KHTILVRDQWIGANQNSFDPTQNGCVGADAQRQAKDSQYGKAGTTPKHPKTEPKILEKRLHLARHSARSASIGFTRVARRAGKKQARIAAAASITLETSRANGSLGLTSYKILARTPPAANESRSPTATASAVCIAPCRIINAKTSRRCAPSAMRMPISRVRQATAYALTPYTPTTARSNAIAPKTPNSFAPSRTTQRSKLFSSKSLNGAILSIGRAESMFRSVWRSLGISPTSACRSFVAKRTCR